MSGFITSLEKLIHLQCDLFRKMSLFCSVLIRSLPQNTINQTKFSGRPYSDGGKSGATSSFFPVWNKVHTGKNHDQYIHTFYSSALLPQAVALYSVKIRGRYDISKSCSMVSGQFTI